MVNFNEQRNSCLIQVPPIAKEMSDKHYSFDLTVNIVTKKTANSNRDYRLLANRPG